MRTRRSAFTLIELVMVVSLLLLLAGVMVGMGGAGATSDYEIRSACRQTAGLLERARSQCAISGSATRLIYDLKKQTAVLQSPRLLEEGETAEDFEEEELFITVGSVSFGHENDMDNSRIWLESIQTYDGVVYDSGEVIIDIRPTGSSIGHVVRIRNLDPLPEDPEIMSVELNPLTGVANIYEFEKKVAEPVKDFG